jgi:eukaryotic-like serine/threonine-protein kinase
LQRTACCFRAWLTGIRGRTGRNALNLRLPRDVQLGRAGVEKSGGVLSLAPAALLSGRYQLEDRIGVGGQGDVWRGVDTILGRAVAIKLLRAEFAQDPEAAARLRAEARHAGALSHPGIAWIQDYHDACQPDPPYLVMELIDGPSLATVLAGGPLDPDRAMDVIAQVAAGLHAAHQAGVVHRDVKPANLVFDRLGNVKITDFGIASCAALAAVTTGVVAGTPAYLAPERAHGAPATPASDLYALGIVGYECLTGHTPYGGTPLELATAHRDAPLPPLPDAVPAEAAGLIAELAAKDPAARPTSARDVSDRAARLRTAMSGGADIPLRFAGPRPESPTLRDIPMPDPPPGRARRLPGDRPRRPRMAVVSAAAAVLLVASLSLLAARMLTAATAAPHGAAGAGAPRQAGTPGFVTVQSSALIGLPVTVVARQLRQLGLPVEVRWRPTGVEPAGTVVSVLPAGKVAAGSIVVVTGALQPQPVGDNGGHDGGGHDGGSGGGHMPAKLGQLR